MTHVANEAFNCSVTTGSHPADLDCRQGDAQDYECKV